VRAVPVADLPERIVDRHADVVVDHLAVV